MLGISVFVAVDDIGPASLVGIRAGKLATYRLVHVVLLDRLLAAGLPVLPTFERPHATVVLDTIDRVDQLVELLGPSTLNPQYGGHRRTRRRTP